MPKFLDGVRWPYHVLRQTLIALVGGQGMSEHVTPGEAIVQVLHGWGRLVVGDVGWEDLPRDLLVILDRAHSREALEDSLVWFTVARSREGHRRP